MNEGNYKKAFEIEGIAEINKLNISYRIHMLGISIGIIKALDLKNDGIVNPDKTIEDKIQDI